MLNIAKAVKAKIDDFSRDNMEAAHELCLEATFFLNRATKTKNTEFIEQAIELYLEAIGLYSRLTEPYIALAYISEQMGKDDDAVKLLRKVLEIDPLNPHANRMLNEIKKNQIDTLISQEALNSLSKKYKPIKVKVKTNFLSKLKEIFSIQPDNQGNTKANQFPDFEPNQMEDFSQLINQTKKLMYNKPN